MLRPTLLLLALALLGCEGPRYVTVQVEIPDLDGTLTPLRGVTVTALPFDRDSLVQVMERERGGTRPHVARLDSLYDAFRGPFLAYFRADQRRAAVSDSVSKGQLPQSALDGAEAQVATAKAALSEARAAVGGPIDSLRAVVSHWEDSTYRGFDSRAKALMDTTGGKPVSDTTDSRGTTTLTLRPLPGGWWVSASSWDPLDPNRIWYWNVQVKSDTVRLDDKTGQHRSR
ncbi:MAG TPA: hypothetical protein VFI41_01535 [Gemmatimonadales bacterium]|nr:hypothetical protein [Gemmatimonadales bacterium]